MVGGLVASLCVALALVAGAVGVSQIWVPAPLRLTGPAPAIRSGLDTARDSVQEVLALADAVEANGTARDALTAALTQAQGIYDASQAKVDDDSTRQALAGRLTEATTALAVPLPADRAGVETQTADLDQAAKTLSEARSAVEQSQAAWQTAQDHQNYTGGNGRLDPATLCAVPYDPKQLLRCDAEAAWMRLDAAYKAHWGEDIPIDLSYRTYDEQVEMKRIWGSGAATPGYSNHGWGTAVDLPDYRLVDDPTYALASLGADWNYGTPKYEWLKAEAPAYDWVNPSWAVQGGVGPHEPWHFEYTG